MEWRYKELLGLINELVKWLNDFFINGFKIIGFTCGKRNVYRLGIICSD